MFTDFSFGEACVISLFYFGLICVCVPVLEYFTSVNNNYRYHYHYKYRKKKYKRQKRLKLISILSFITTMATYNVDATKLEGILLQFKYHRQPTLNTFHHILNEGYGLSISVSYTHLTLPTTASV